MTRSKPNIDGIASEVEQALQIQGWYESWATSSFVNRLHRVEERVARIISTAPGRAADLYETMIGGAHEAAESVDDSNGELAAFVETAFKGWIRARQAAREPADETVDALLAWMVDDNYGFCHRIEEVVVEAMAPATLAAFGATARQALDELRGGEGAAGDTLDEGRWENILREVTWRQGNVGAYRALCDEFGWRPADALRLVEHHTELQAWQDALHWADRGLELVAGERWRDGTEYELTRQRRDMLALLGRGSEVLAELWAAYEAYASKHTYETLMAYVPESEQATWRERALSVTPQGGLAGALDLWYRAGADDRIVEAIGTAADKELEAISHYVLEPVAAKLEAVRVDLAAKVHRALGWRIVAAGKSRYYAQALEHFRQARRCYISAGLEQDWLAIARRLRAEHGRKRGFLDEFERSVERLAPPPPSATDRARSRWAKATSRAAAPKDPGGAP